MWVQDDKKYAFVLRNALEKRCHAGYLINFLMNSENTAALF